MMQHRLSTTDPISLKEVHNLPGKPFIVEGPPDNDLTIYFENEKNQHKYEDIPVEHPGNDFSHDVGNNVTEGIDMG